MTEETRDRGEGCHQMKLTTTADGKDHRGPTCHPVHLGARGWLSGVRWRHHNRVTTTCGRLQRRRRAEREGHTSVLPTTHSCTSDLGPAVGLKEKVVGVQEVLHRDSSGKAGRFHFRRYAVQVQLKENGCHLPDHRDSTVKEICLLKVFVFKGRNNMHSMFSTTAVDPIETNGQTVSIIYI